MLISYCNLGLKKDGKPQRPWDNCPLERRELKEVWLAQNTMNPDAPKGTTGEMFSFDWDKLYSIDEARTNSMTDAGILFMDLDWKDETEESIRLADFIYDHIDEINDAINRPILCASRTVHGIHAIFMCGDRLNATEHENKTVECIATFAHMVDKLYGIDIRKAIDPSSVSLKQRFYLRGNQKPVYWNDVCFPFFTLDASQVKVLKGKFPDLFKKYRDAPAPKENEVDVDIKNVSFSGKFTITHDFGAAARWRVASGLRRIYGDDIARRMFDIFCDELVKWREMNGITGTPANVMKNNNWGGRGTNKLASIDVILMHDIGVDIDSEIKSDAIEVSNKNKVLQPEEYMADRIDEVLGFWDTNPLCMLVGVTGIGKTELIKLISHHRRTLVLVPYNDMLGIYKNSKPIKGVSEVYSSDDIKEFVGKKSVCVIWDQLKKIFDYVKDNNFNIIVDESHLLYASTWRDSATDVIGMLQELIKGGSKVMFISATPTLEHDMFGIPKDATLTYEKAGGKKRTIEVLYGMTNVSGKGTADWRIKGDVRRSFKQGLYDCICVWTDEYNHRLSDHWRDLGLPVIQIHKEKSKYDRKVAGDIKTLKEDELILPNNIYVFTKLTENGFNFNTKNKKDEKDTSKDVLVIIQVKKGSFDYSKIVQIVGRFRDANFVYVKVYVEPEPDHELTIDEKHEKAILSTKYESINGDDHYTREDVVTNEKIYEKYSMEHGSVEGLIKDLEEYLGGGKFVIHTTDLSNSEAFMRINGEVKKREEQMVYENRIRKGDLGMHGSFYGDKLVAKFRELVSLYGYQRVMLIVDKLLEVAKKKSGETKNVSTVIDEVMRYLPWVINDDQWVENRKNEVNAVCATLKSKALIKNLHDDLSNALRWRDKYGRLEDWNSWINNMSVACDLDIIEMAEQYSKSHSVKHKEHKKKMYRCQDGFEGTKDEISSHLKKSLSTVERYISKGLIIKM